MILSRILWRLTHPRFLRRYGDRKARAEQLPADDTIPVDDLRRKTHHFVIDLNERGEFLAHVENDATGAIVWSISTEEAHSFVEDGFVKSWSRRDLADLAGYLMSVGIFKEGDVLLWQG